MPTRPKIAAACLVGSGLALLALPACSGVGYSYRSFHDEGGSGYSDDKFVYVSRPFDPKTITVVDTRTGEALWTMDVPVGQRLVIDFEVDKADADSDRPDLMRWELMDESEIYGRLDNAMPVPPQDSRRIDVSLRATPEIGR